MLKDYEYERLIKPLTEIYDQIELELILEIAKRFDTYDTVGGTLKWQIDKLDDLGVLNNDTLKIIAKYSNRSETSIKQLMNSAGYESIDKETIKKVYDKNIINTDPNILYNSKAISNIINTAIFESKDIMNVINTKAVESVKENYMNILNQAYLEVSSGIYNYNTSIKKALMKMADDGITGATYKRKDGTVVNYSLEGTIRRDILTKSHQTANSVSMKTIEDIGQNLVYIPSHLGARISKNKIANHAGWQGKVYMVMGKSDKYSNLTEETGYGTVEGLGGVNCRHHISMYIEGITRIPEAIDIEENERIYNLTKKQRELERAVRKQKRIVEVAKSTLDTKLIREEKSKLVEKNKKLKQFIEDNPELKYDYARVNIQKFKHTNERVERYKNIIDLPNTKVKITEISTHIIERAIERGVTPEYIENTLTNPLKYGKIITDSKGRNSYKVIGQFATIAINSDTGVITTVWPTSSRLSNKLKSKGSE